MAEAIAAMSRGGTSRPFSPSRTTSGIPPTAVAITGVPVASASSSVCGRFSQADVRSAASTARNSAITSSRVPAPRKRTRSASPSSPARRSSSARSGPSPRTRSATSGTRARASSVSPSAFCAVSRPATPSAKPSMPRVARASSRVGCSGTSGAGFGTTSTREGSRPQPIAICRRYALGTTMRRARRRAAVRVARRNRRRRPRRSAWNSSSVPANRPARRSRSYASSATSLTTSGRRPSAAPSAARRTIVVA